ncbi:hypothetical protein J6590_033559, partial [Homalodisca vitripennis]
GAPPHYKDFVRDALNDKFGQRWNPGFDSMRFFVWGYVKNIVYSQKIRDLAHLKERIYEEAVSSVTRDMLHSVWAEIDHRLDVCRAIGGGHIEMY